MKGFRGFVITLGVMLTVMAFFPGISAFADGPHDGLQTTAEQVNDRDTTESFVLHAKQHIDDIVQTTPSALSTLYRQMRVEGVWNHNSVYLIALRGDGTVVNHGKYTKSLFGASLGNFPTVMRLKEMLEQSTEGEAVCVQYGPSESSRWSCAVEYTNALRGTNILVGGFDHDEQDMNIRHPDCPDYEPAVTAQQLNESQSEEDLENFVKGAIMRIRETLGEGASGLRGNISGVQCLGIEGPWKHGSIYLFIMTAGARGNPPIVFLNGNNPEFTGSPFVNIFDEDGVDVGGIIIEAAGEDGKGGIVRYKWDNPLITEDDVSEPGMSPGTSPKVSYVEGVRISPNHDFVWIFGSGIYPEPKAEDDGGCAIAGTDSNLAGAVFNLFLIVFSLCIVFWWKDRSKA